MGWIYFNISECNTEWVEVLGYILCSRLAKCLVRVWQYDQLWAIASIPCFHNNLSLCLPFILPGVCANFRNIVRNNSQQLEGPTPPFPRKNQDSPEKACSANMNKCSKTQRRVLSHTETGFLSVLSNSSFLLVWQAHQGGWQQDQCHNLRMKMQVICSLI